MRDGDVGRLLASVPVPGELDARRRSWIVVRAAFDTRERVPQPQSPPLRPILALVGALAVVAATLSPPGRAVLADVRDTFVRERVRVERAQPALFSLPTRGRLLVESSHGPWIVRADGAKRRLGPYAEASWSPHGLYVVAARANELVTLEPDGDVRWSIARPDVRHPRWGGSRTDTRIAYLSGSNLRVVAGDGRGDTAIAGDLALTPPAWQPGSSHVVAFADRYGFVHAYETDTKTLLLRRRLGNAPSALAWSPDGERLVAVVPRRGGSDVVVFDARGRRVARQREPGHVEAIAFAPTGRRLALARHERAGELVVMNLDSASRASSRVFSGAGRFTDVAWSPDGRWLLVAWESADQWVFVRTRRGVSKIVARSSIRKQLNRGGSRAPFPRIAGWCCP